MGFSGACRAPLRATCRLVSCRSFSEAELDSTNLQQMRDALRRIDEGTFGRCIVDGEPIEEKRLEAVPWTPYCLKHQEALEAVSPPTTPTL
jgi:DnaK suppressor protein